MKRDGHTHTEYCPHGSHEDTELFIHKAIKLGFTEYSITEHAPLPPGVFENAGGPRIVWDTAAMALNDVDHYLKKMHRLKKKYAADILLHIGFELDYFPKAEAWTKDLLDEYGAQTDDGLLSVHFLPGVDGLRGIDYSYEDYQEGVVAYAGSFQKAQIKYFQTVLKSLEADLGFFKPKRLGHITLCQKYQKAFSDTTDFAPESLNLIEEILTKTKEQNFQLDLNTAGLYKKDCGETYPTIEIIEKGIDKGIEFVYGSDMHDLADVGRSYETVEKYV